VSTTTAAGGVSLDYADVVTRWGISCVREDGILRLVVPPVPSFRLLGRGYLIASIVLIAIPSVMTVAYLIAPGGAWGAVLGNWIMYGGVLAIVLARARYRLSRRIVFEVTPEHLIFSRPGAGGGSNAAWPRHRILAVKRNAYSGLLLLRIAGEDTREFYVSPDRRVTEWVAKTLDEALHEDVPPLASMACAPTAAPHGPASVPPAAAPQRGSGVTIALGVLALIGAVSFFLFGGAWCAIVELGLLLAAIPAGIAFGTQDKDFYA